MFKRQPEVKMLRFRCEHCGSRLVTPERFVDCVVTCYACEQTTHPAANGDGTSTLPAPPPPVPTNALIVASRAAAAEIHPALQLCAAPLAPVLVIAAALIAFIVAVRLSGALGRVVAIAILIALIISGRHWLKAVFLAILDRLDQVEAVRLHHGSRCVVSNLLAWFWRQPRGRKAWAGMLMLVWLVLYTPYLVSATLFFWPRSRPLTMRV